jgi:hypothetical protein
MPRTSLLIRCSRQTAHAIRAEALSEHRSVSGYLLRVIERSLWVEEKSLAGRSIVPQTVDIEMPHDRTAIHLRCSEDEASRIRVAAKKRSMSISSFVVFSLRRHWRAVERVRGF